MPKESLSVYLTAVDKMSPALASITDKTRALDKESQQLQQTYEALQKANKGLIERKTELQKKLQEVNEEVKEARKNFRDLGDEASSDAYAKAQENQQKLRNEIAATNKSLQENQKIYKENIEAVRKGNADTEGAGLGGLAQLGGLAAGLGVWDQAMSLTQSGTSALAGSALGADGGNTLASAMGGALSGATLGFSVGGPLGAAVGAGVGLAAGAAQGAIQQWENQDAAFKDYYGGLYQEASEESNRMVETGSSIAGGREKDRISFKTLFGSEEVADGYLENMVEMANRTPFLYDDLVAMSKTLATYGYSPDEESKDYILDALQTIGDAGAALGMSTGDMNTVATALGRMKSSDKATLEYLNMLNDRGIGAVGMLAQAKGVSQGTMYGMISKGEISGTEAVEIITAALEKAYSGSMEEQSQTFEGLTSTLEGLTQELENAGGEAYNTLRESGISAMTDAYGGELGEAIKEVNAVIGENRARQENLRDQYMRETLDMALNGNKGELWSQLDEKQQADLTKLSEEFAEWSQKYEESGRTDEEAGAQIEALSERARVLGQEYFDNSGLMKILNDTEEDEIDAIRQNTIGLTNATTAAYRLEQVLSRGGVVLFGAGGAPTSTVTSGTDGTGSGEDLEVMPWTPDMDPYSALVVAQSHAFGLDRVPYDEYPALLHEGERVLTAAEARAQDAAGGGWGLVINVTGNSFTGTPEDMAGQLAQILLLRLTQAGVAAVPK